MVKVNFCYNEILCFCKNLDFLDWLFILKVDILKIEECIYNIWVLVFEGRMW